MHYILDSKGKLDIITFNKDTLEKMDVKTLEFEVESDLTSVTESKNAIYVKYNVSDTNLKESNNKVCITKIVKDKIEWKLELDSVIIEDTNIVEFENHLIIPASHIKSLKKLIYYIDNKNGKTKEVIESDYKITSVYNRDVKNSIIALYNIDGNKHIGKLDKTIKKYGI